MNQTNTVTSAQRKDYIHLILLSLLTGGMIILQAYLFVTIIHGVFLDSMTMQAVLPLLGGLLLVILLRIIFSHLNGKKGIQMGTVKKQAFRKELVQTYTKNPLQSSIGGQSGKKVSILMDAVDEVDSYYSQYLPQVIQSTIIPLEILIIVFMTHANSGWIMVITTPFIPIFMIIIGMQTKKKSEEQLEALGQFSGRFLDILQGLVTLKLFGRAKQQKEVIRDSSLHFRKATMEILKVAFTNSFMLELISMLSIGIIALEVAFQLILFDGITFAPAFLVLLLAPEFYTALKTLGSAFHNGKSSMGAVEKIKQELEQTGQAGQWGNRTFDTLQGPPAIVLDQIGFKYGEENFALKGIHASFIPNHQYAIAGPSGAGKSTLLNLISGLLTPSEGSILVNGYPLEDYRENEWFHIISYISQHPYIFAGTIAENIAMGDCTQENRTAITDAAGQAGLGMFIQSLQEGIDTKVGEAGRGLSGGEKQRLALARAFFKKPSVILFDEPTTGLDLQTERILQDSIQALSANAAIITVAHRLHTIQKADTIIYMDNGRQIGTGNHQQLMHDVPEYRAMVNMQQGRYQA